MIHINDLKFSYDNNELINLNIKNCCIKKGECIVVCGASGSGKTTFMRILNGLIPNFFKGKLSGDIRINNHNIKQFSCEQLSEIVGSIFQNPTTHFFHRRVLDELVFGCEMNGVCKNDIQKRLDEIVELFSLQSLLEKDMYTLSGGEQQKIAIASVVMRLPDIILLDEPTANLDDFGIHTLIHQLQLLKSLGMTIIICEHRLAPFNKIADKYFYFNNGELQTIYSNQEFNDLTTETLKNLFLRQNKNQIVKYRCDEYINGLLIKNLDLKYDYIFKSIKQLHFNYNTIYGIVGKNGVGKSTLLKTIAGLLNCPGSFFINNEILTAKQRLNLTTIVLQDVRLQLFNSCVALEVNNKMYLETLSLTHLVDRHPMTLSGGEMQRVVVANALSQKKAIFLFDEPTSGLDYKNMLEVATLIKTLKQEQHIVVVASHDIEFLNLCCDYIIEI